MNIKAINLKSWCIDNISPLAWSRIVLRVLPELRDLGHSLEAVENPKPDLILNDKALVVIGKAMQTLYEMDIPEEVEKV
jgi:hypothetical protein